MSVKDSYEDEISFSARLRTNSPDPSFQTCWYNNQKTNIEEHIRNERTISPQEVYVAPHE